MDSSVPTVSIVMPVFNVAGFLGETLDSVLAQSFTDWELLLIDDGSADETAEICREYAARDSRIRFRSGPNRGVSGARNQGIDLARGKYLTFVDGDDLLAPNYLEVLLAPFADARVQASAVDVLLFSDSAAIRWADAGAARRRKLRGDDILAAAMYLDGLSESPFAFLILRTLWGNLRFPAGKQYEDLFIMPELYARCEVLVKCEVPLYAYRQRAGSAMHPDVVASQRLFDYVLAIEEVLRSAEKGSPVVRRAAEACACLAALRLKRLLPKSDCSASERAKLVDFVAEVRGNLVWRVLRDARCPLRIKVRIAMLSWMQWAVPVLQAIGGVRNRTQ